MIYEQRTEAPLPYLHSLTRNGVCEAGGHPCMNDVHEASERSLCAFHEALDAIDQYDEAPLTKQQIEQARVWVERLTDGERRRLLGPK